MNSGRILATNTVATGSLPPELGEKRPGFVALVFLATWCGLVAGLLEVGTIVIRKQTYDPNHFYRMSHHFAWLIPVTEVCVFLAAALVGYTLFLVWPGRGRWLVRASYVCTDSLADSLGCLAPDLLFGQVDAGARGSRGPGAASSSGMAGDSSGSSGSPFPASWRLWLSWRHHRGLAIGSSSHARARGRCRRRVRPMYS